MPTVPMTRPALRTALAAGAVLGLGAALAIPAQAALVDSPTDATTPNATVDLSLLGTYETGVFDESAAEIVAFHAATAQLYSVDANAGAVNVLDASDPTAPSLLGVLTVGGIVDDAGVTIPASASANSVAVREDGLVVVAVENDPKTDAGWLAFFDSEGAALGAVRVGAQPDAVALTPDGTAAVTADEGEPNDAYDVDPEGTVSIVALPAAVAAPAQGDVATANFHAFEGDALPAGVRVFAGIDGIDLPVSRNLEPEYVAIDETSTTAYVTLQENNAIAVVDLASATVTDVWSLGAKDHSASNMGIDPSDRDGVREIRRVPVKGLYMPDAIAAYTAVNGTTYLVTANEGDARDDWGDYEESVRVKDLGEDGIPPLCEGVLTEAQLADSDLGRLTVSRASGLSEDGSCYEELYAFGARSFSVWTTDGDLVMDSGHDFELISGGTQRTGFNSSNDETGFDSRSDNKGPEPEGVAVGEVGGRIYAFIGLERIGGVMVYDITNPHGKKVLTYVNNRDFDADPQSPEAGDLGPEGLAFIAAADSPTGEAMLAVGNEVSGSTTLYGITELRGSRR